jgi:hypothetical protein
MGLPFGRNRFSNKTTEAVMIIWISTGATNDDYLYVDITFGYDISVFTFLERPRRGSITYRKSQARIT